MSWFIGIYSSSHPSNILKFILRFWLSEEEFKHKVTNCMMWDKNWKSLLLLIWFSIYNKYIWHISDRVPFQQEFSKQKCSKFQAFKTCFWGEYCGTSVVQNSAKELILCSGQFLHVIWWWSIVIFNQLFLGNLWEHIQFSVCLQTLIFSS